MKSNELKPRSSSLDNKLNAIKTMSSKKLFYTRSDDDSLICWSCERSAKTFDGVKAAIESLHTLEDGSELPHSYLFQLQELTLVPRQHEGLDSLPLSTRWRDLDYDNNKEHEERRDVETGSAQLK